MTLDGTSEVPRVQERSLIILYVCTHIHHKIVFLARTHDDDLLGAMICCTKNGHNFILLWLLESLVVRRIVFLSLAYFEGIRT